MADLTPDDLLRVAKDSFYISVGLGVIAFQKTQVRRQELTKQLDSATKEARIALRKAIDDAR